MCTEISRITDILKRVGVDEASHFGIVVSRLEIVQPRFAVIVVTAVADGIDVRDVGRVGDALSTLYQISPSLSRFPAANFKNYRFATHGWGLNFKTPKKTPPTEVGGEHCCF